jgi:hypothetical protein
MSPAKEPDLYPIRLYIYSSDGTYGEPIMIMSEDHLMGVGTQFVVRHAVETGHEVMMTDPNDFCLFHAKEGKVIFPPRP